MSKAQGSPFSTHCWHPQIYQLVHSPTSPRRCLTQDEKEKVMKQIGEIVWQLSCLRLDKIGSLFEEGECYVVKDCLSPGFFLHDRYTLRDIKRGPFLQDVDYYRSLLSAYLLHIQYLLLEHHVFFAPVPVPSEYNSYASYLSATDRWNDFVTVGSKVDCSKNRLDYTIAGRFLEGMISSFTIKSHEFANGYNNGFPLHHPDLSVNNIFVDVISTSLVLLTGHLRPLYPWPNFLQHQACLTQGTTLNRHLPPHSGLGSQIVWMEKK